MTQEQLLTRFGRIRLLDQAALAALTSGAADEETQMAAAYRIELLSRTLREQAANQEKMRLALEAIMHGEANDPAVTAVDALVDAKALNAGAARAWASVQSRELTLVVQAKATRREDLMAQLTSRTLQADLEAGFVGGVATTASGSYRYALRDTGRMIAVLTKQAA